MIITYSYFGKKSSFISLPQSRIKFIIERKKNFSITSWCYIVIEILYMRILSRMFVHIISEFISIHLFIFSLTHSYSSIKKIRMGTSDKKKIQQKSLWIFILFLLKCFHWNIIQIYLPFGWYLNFFQEQKFSWKLFKIWQSSKQENNVEEFRQHSNGDF